MSFHPGKDEPHSGTLSPLYKKAGVDRDAAEAAKEHIRDIATRTHGPQVLGGIGGFGALYQLSGYKEPVLVSSTDGIGTKLKLGIAMGRFESLGHDLVNACINDIVVCGSHPIFFLDYIALGKMDSNTVLALIKGMSDACAQSKCALIGGETAEMPGVYSEGDFDLAGFVVGAVEKKDIIDGSKIREGYLLVGVPSNGPHTNGYSLIRKVFNLDNGPSALKQYNDELGSTLGDALLRTHTPYYPVLSPVYALLGGMAHITGGGLLENVPRVLPKGLAARFDNTSWQVPPLFSLIQKTGKIEMREMYRVFNMGVGMVLMCSPENLNEVLARVKGAWLAGDVIKAGSGPRVII